MKKKLFFSVFTILMISVLVLYATFINDSSNSFLIEENIDALSQTEIIVGPLCMEAENYACTSLGEVFLDHYPG